MFTIIRTRNLAALREEAAQLPGLRRQVTEARHAAEAAAAEASRLGDELDAAIAEVKASGDPAAIEGIRAMDALLGEDLSSLSSSTRPAASLSTASCGPGSTPQQHPEVRTDEH